MATELLEATKKKRTPLPLPTAKLPRGAVLDSLDAEDQFLLDRFLNEASFFVDHPEFASRGVERKLYGVDTKLVGRGTTHFVEGPDDIADAVAAGERVPTLSYDQEKHVFMRFNYARRAVDQILSDFAGKTLTPAATRRLIAWGHRVINARVVVVRINMPLVLAMAKRTRLTSIDFNDMISEGNMALLRSVEKFDCSKGFKFSTYSCRAILKSFSRVAMRASRYRCRFPTDFDPAMERSDFLETKRSGVEEDCVDELKEILVRNTASLSEVENTVILERFAIGKIPDSESGPKTLEQVGRIIGVTKERVRQIQNKALKKIRVALEEEYLAA